MICRRLSKCIFRLEITEDFQSGDHSETLINDIWSRNPQIPWTVFRSIFDISLKKYNRKYSEKAIKCSVVPGKDKVDVLRQ